MRIIVKAKTKAKKETVVRLGQPTLGFDSDFSLGKSKMIIYRVSVKEAPVAGHANQAIIIALAKYFDIARSRIRLVSGQTSKQKIFEIN